MHPQYELDHVNAVFHQNYRDAYLDNQFRTARGARPCPAAAFGNTFRVWIVAMLIAVADKVRPQAIPASESVTGSDANRATGAPASRAYPA